MIPFIWKKKKNQKNMSMKSSYSGYWVIDGGGLDNSSGKLPYLVIW